MSVARIYRAATPYNASELSELDYVQSFDVLYLAHLDHVRSKLIRSGHADWEYVALSTGPTIAAPTSLSVAVTNPNQDAANSGNAYFPQPRHYVVTSVNDTTGQESRASTSDDGTNDLTLKRNKNVLTWVAATGANRYRVYAADNEQAYGYIGETIGTMFTDDNLTLDFTDGPPTGDDPFSGDDDNPSTVTFFEQRLWWARTRARPNAVFGSQSADFENHDIARPSKESDAISIAIAAQKVNSVHSLVPMENLLALTGDAIFAIKGSNADYLTASPPPRVPRQSGRGANRLKPLVLDEVIFYQPAIGSEVRSLGFTFEIDGYRSNDVSIFSPGFFRSYEINAWDYAEEPLSVVWTARSDGKMPTFTWQQEQQVWGWTLCETDGAVEDVIAVREGGEDRPYLIVTRTIDGEERRFLERMASAKWEDVKQSCYLDCAATFEPATPTSVFYVPHLAGATVDALADGFVVTGLTVESDGRVEFAEDVNEVVTIGLPYEAVIETLPLMFETREGWPRDKRQMIGEAVLQVVDTRIGSVEAGRRLSKMYATKARGTEALGEPTALFTGARTAATEPLTAGEATLFVRSTEPTPMTITAIYLDPIVSQDT